MTNQNPAQKAGAATLKVPADVVEASAKELANLIDAARDFVTGAANQGDVAADALLDGLSSHFAAADAIIAKLLHLTGGTGA